MPPVSVPAYLIACGVGLFVGTLCFMVLGLAVPLGGAPAAGLPPLEHLPQMMGAFLFMPALYTILLVVPVAIVAAPVVLPVLIRLKRLGLVSRWAAAVIGAVTAVVAVVIPMLILTLFDSDPAPAQAAAFGGLLALPGGAAAGLTYRALVARLLKTARPT